MTTVNEMLDAMTGRALDLLDARSWLLRLDCAYDSAQMTLEAPTMPVVDADGSPVVVALVWRSGIGEPLFIAEFDSLVQRFRALDRVGTEPHWVGMSEESFLRLLHAAHVNGLFVADTPPSGRPDTGGAMTTGGDVGITVTRGGETIPIDPSAGLAEGSVGDEAEQFLRDVTRGD